MAASTRTPSVGRQPGNTQKPMHMDEEMVTADEGVKVTKRKLEGSKVEKVTDQEDDKTAWLMDQLKQKDALIANLMSMMEGMKQQPLTLQASMDQLAKQKAEGSDGSTEGENL